MHVVPPHFLVLYNAHAISFNARCSNPFNSGTVKTKSDVLTNLPAAGLKQGSLQ